MGTILGTVKGVSLMTGSPAGITHTVSAVNYVRKSYLVSLDFPAYASTDSGQITGLPAQINAFIRDGKTRVLRADAPPTCVSAGADTAAQAVFIGTCTVSGANVTFDLTDGAATELTAATASSGVSLIVPVDETPA